MTKDSEEEVEEVEVEEEEVEADASGKGWKLPERKRSRLCNWQGGGGRGSRGGS